MKSLSIATSAALLACSLAGFAQTEVACDQALDVRLRSRAVLAIDSPPAGLEIVGTGQEAIHLTCTAGDGGDRRDIRIRFSGNQDDGKLTITGSSLHKSNLQVHIEVPRRTSLRVQMPAGQVRVEDIAGNKDIDLYAGQIAISSARPWDYRSVRLSVCIGQVSAPVYGEEKGGFFRTVTRQNADGEYWLHAHVLTGQIELLGDHARTAAE